MEAQAALWEQEEKDGKAGPPPHPPHPPHPPLLAPGDVAWAFVKGHNPWPCIVLTREEGTRLGASVGARAANKVSVGGRWCALMGLCGQAGRCLHGVHPGVL